MLGRAPKAALDKLHLAGFSAITFIAVRDRHPAGAIIGQRPKAGVQVATAASIRLTVSAGSEPTGAGVRVPGIGTCDFGFYPTPQTPQPRPYTCVGGPIFAHLAK